MPQTLFHRYHFQIIASMAKNLLMLDLGLAVSFSTIVIPALTGDDVVHNPNEYLRIDASAGIMAG